MKKIVTVILALALCASALTIVRAEEEVPQPYEYSNAQFFYVKGGENLCKYFEEKKLLPSDERANDAAKCKKAAAWLNDRVVGEQVEEWYQKNVINLSEARPMLFPFISATEFAKNEVVKYEAGVVAPKIAQLESDAEFWADRAERLGKLEEAYRKIAAEKEAIAARAAKAETAAKKAKGEAERLAKALNEQKTLTQANADAIEKEWRPKYAALEREKEVLEKENKKLAEDRDFHRTLNWYLGGIVALLLALLAIVFLGKDRRQAPKASEATAGLRGVNDFLSARAEETESVLKDINDGLNEGEEVFVRSLKFPGVEYKFLVGGKNAKDYHHGKMATFHDLVCVQCQARGVSSVIHSIPMKNRVDHASLHDREVEARVA